MSSIMAALDRYSLAMLILDPLKSFQCISNELMTGLHAREERPKPMRQSRIGLDLRLYAVLLSQHLLVDQGFISKYVRSTNLEEYRGQVTVTSRPVERDIELVVIIRL